MELNEKSYKVYERTSTVSGKIKYLSLILYFITYFINNDSSIPFLCVCFCFASVCVQTISDMMAISLMINEIDENDIEDDED